MNRACYLLCAMLLCAARAFSQIPSEECGSKPSGHWIISKNKKDTQCSLTVDMRSPWVTVPKAVTVSNKAEVMVVVTPPREYDCPPVTFKITPVKKTNALAAVLSTIVGGKFPTILGADAQTESVVYRLPKYRNSQITGEIVCKPSAPNNKDTNKGPVPVDITYESFDYASASLGAVFSTLDQHVVGLRTKSNADGTFTTFFGVTNQSPIQIIPFSLAHLFIYGKTNTNVSLAGGVGINTYNGSTQIEYFVGPSYLTHKFYLSCGAHIGRYQTLANGFRVGDPVPPGFGNSPVPTTYYYTTHLGFGVTYQIK